MLASITRLRVRSLLDLPAFLWLTFRVQRQTTHATGFRGGRLLIDNIRTYWTLTVWEDEKSMKAFRGAGSHAKAMTKLAQWCDEAAYAHWNLSDVSDETVPGWTTAYERLVSDGKLSRVAKPSADHLARKFPKPRLKPTIGQDLKPAA